MRISTVIDQQLVWYGRINYLGFEKAAQGAMRLSNGDLATELLAFFEKNKS